MTGSGVVLIFLALYFAVNFLCALVLHLHGERQAHLPLRFMDVFVHFVLMTAFAIPVLLVITAEAMFGGRERVGIAKAGKVPATRAA